MVWTNGPKGVNMQTIKSETTKVCTYIYRVPSVPRHFIMIDLIDSNKPYPRDTNMHSPSVTCSQIMSDASLLINNETEK